MIFVIYLTPAAPGIQVEAGYLRAFDPEAHEGLGRVRLTPNLRHAMRFTDARAAFTLWQTVPRCRPQRHDGRPNRPLTAFNMETIPLP